MIPDLNSDGHLPPGRYRCTVEEVRTRFVTSDHFAESSTRKEVWSHWEHALEAFRGTVPHVCSAWLGGSFISSKTDPDDVDSVFVVEHSVLDGVVAGGGDAARLLTLFSQNSLKGAGLRVDSFVLNWVVSADGQWSAGDNGYLQQRGYWDDFWQRSRSGPKGEPPCRKDALPSRGYLEVILDGYPE